MKAKIIAAIEQHEKAWAVRLPPELRAAIADDAIRIVEEHWVNAAKAALTPKAEELALAPPDGKPK